MKADVVRVVQTYIDAVTRNDPGAVPLHDEFDFISPLGNTQLVSRKGDYRGAIARFRLADESARQWGPITCIGVNRCSTPASDRAQLDALLQEVARG